MNKNHIFRTLLRSKGIRNIYPCISRPKQKNSSSGGNVILQCSPGANTQFEEVSFFWLLHETAYEAKRWLVSSRASFSFLASRPKISSTLKGMLFPCSLFTIPSLKWQSPRHLLGDSLKLIDFSGCSYFIDLVSEKNPTGLFSQDNVFCVRWASECWVQKMIKIGGFSGVKLSLNQQWFER